MYYIYYRLLHQTQFLSLAYFKQTLSITKRSARVVLSSRFSTRIYFLVSNFLFSLSLSLTSVSRGLVCMDTDIEG